ncbi:MAG: succinylglutamate desuccinylase/aspartoacylase family protein [Saprospiraceae bacterium]|nr:succinylglutamate desuccinylase/aspartoacylase family protein [Saprospiraceae bacterium]
MSEIKTDRIIGRYEGIEPGPLLVVTAAMHGNEFAGVKALELVFKMLEVEPVTNPDFVYHGTIIGIIGNVKAYKQGKRYINRDINRMWSEELVQKIKSSEESELDDEENEISELLKVISKETLSGKYQKMILFDLHTTSSRGGIFSITTEDTESIRIASALHAPVVRGLLKGISGTSLHYFCTQNMGIDCTALAFEAGQHEEPKSVNRTIAAIINCMRSIGSVKEHDVENIHDELLLNYSKDLPQVVKVIDKYTVLDNSNWIMQPGYTHFKNIRKGELLANDFNGPVFASHDGLILMPLYQTQGNDGFFIVEPCS